MATYRLTFNIKGSDKLGVILAALSKEGVTFHIDEINGTAQATLRRSPPQRRSNSKVINLLLEMTPVGSEVDRAVFANKLQAEGLSASSVSPSISKMIQAGVLTRSKDGTVTRIK